MVTPGTYHIYPIVMVTPGIFSRYIPLPWQLAGFLIVTYIALPAYIQTDGPFDCGI